MIRALQTSYIIYFHITTLVVLYSIQLPPGLIYISIVRISFRMKFSKFDALILNSTYPVLNQK